MVMATLALLSRFLARELELAVIAADGAALAAVPRGDGALLVFPGSFDPLHEGHTSLAAAAVAAARARDGRDPSLVYELSLQNADKGVVDAAAVERRLRQFAARGAAVALTRKPLYVDKSELLGPCDFVIGADTATRVLDAKYYGGDGGLEDALETLRGRGCGFIVAGRLNSSADRFVQTDEAIATAPTAFKDMFLEIPDFRVDLSSTELRASESESAGRR